MTGMHMGHAIAWVVSHQLLTAEAQVRVQGSQCENRGGQSGTGTRFDLSSLVFPC
jgi:hypothetical protein